MSLSHTHSLPLSLSLSLSLYLSLSLTHTLLDLIVVLQNEIVTCAQLITIIMCQLMMIIRMAWLKSIKTFSIQFQLNSRARNHKAISSSSQITLIEKYTSLLKISQKSSLVSVFLCKNTKFACSKWFSFGAVYKVPVFIF